MREMIVPDHDVICQQLSAEYPTAEWDTTRWGFFGLENVTMVTTTKTTTTTTIYITICGGHPWDRLTMGVRQSSSHSQNIPLHHHLSLSLSLSLSRTLSRSLSLFPPSLPLWIRAIGPGPESEENV